MHALHTLREAILIHSLPSKVWAVLTQPDYTDQFYPGKLVCQSWVTGHPVYLHKEEQGRITTYVGRVQSSVPGLLLEFSWEQSVLPEYGTETRFEILPHEEGVEVKLIQQLLCPDKAMALSEAQHWKNVLQKIKWLSEYS